MTAITDVTQLEPGDKVTVRGNGVCVTRRVASIGQDRWKGKQIAQLEGDDFAYRLSAKDSHPLQSGDGMHLAGVGTVKVSRTN